MESVEGEDASSEGGDSAASRRRIAIRGGGCRLFVFDRLGIVGGVLAVTPASVVLRYSDGNFYTMHFCVDACFRLWLLCGES